MAVRQHMAIVFTAFLAVGVSLSGVAFAVPERPQYNIVLLTLDSINTRLLGLHGGAEPLTPTLDKLSRESATLASCYAPAAWTTPSIVSLLTGVSPLIHSVHHRGDRPPTSLVTLAEALAANGYDVPLLSYLVDQANYENLGFSELGEDYASLSSRERLWKYLETPTGHPFFIWFHEKHCHLPYLPDDRRTLDYLRSTPLPASEYVDMARERSMILRGELQNASAAERQAIEDLYSATIREQDAFIAEVIRKLRKNNLWQSTIFVVTADHGEEIWERGTVGHASTSMVGHLHEELTHVPLVIRVPKGKPNLNDALVRLEDVAPTLLELVGTAVPSTMQGKVLKRAMNSADKGGHKYVFGVTAPAGWNTLPEDASNLNYAIRSKESLYLERTAKNKRVATRFYDLETNADERKNLYLRQHLMRSDKLKTELSEWIVRSTALRRRLVTDFPKSEPLPDGAFQELLRGKLRHLEGQVEDALSHWKSGLVKAEAEGNKELVEVLQGLLARESSVTNDKTHENKQESTPAPTKQGRKNSR